MKERATIFGGMGKMGALTNSWLQTSGFETVIVDPAKPDCMSASEAIKDSSIIFFSVDPKEIPLILDAIHSADEFAFVGKSLLDNSGEKLLLINHYSNLDSKGASICSTHPLFGPLAEGNTEEETVLIMPFGKNARNAEEIARKVHSSIGARLETIDFEEHDEIMAIQQLLPHEVMRAVGCMLSDMGYDINTLIKTGPANSKLFWLSCARVNGQNPETSTRIIKGNLPNTNNGKIIRKELATQMHEMQLAQQEILNSSFEEASERIIPKGNRDAIMDMTSSVIKFLKQKV